MTCHLGMMSDMYSDALRAQERRLDGIYRASGGISESRDTSSYVEL